MAVHIGSYILDRDQPALSVEGGALARRFHDLDYRRWQAGGDTTNLIWFGYELIKSPLDIVTPQTHSPAMVGLR